MVYKNKFSYFLILLLSKYKLYVPIDKLLTFKFCKAENVFILPSLKDTFKTKVMNIIGLLRNDFSDKKPFNESVLNSFSDFMYFYGEELSSIFTFEVYYEIFFKTGLKECHIPFIKRTHVIVEFLPPVDIANLSRDEKKELPGKIYNAILDTYNKNQQEI